ncbi:MAG: hypothetical protein ACRENP_00915 [Longimicrobiales bacterium]
MRVASAVAAGGLGLALVCAPVQAQQGGLGGGTRPDRPCLLGPISYVFVDNHSIFDTQSEPARRFSWFYRAANKLHVRTRRATITRELLLGPGDCFDPILAEESERLLRAYDYLAQVDIFGVPQPDGSYHVVVDTRDEWSTQLDVRVAFQDGVDFEGARLREANLFGRGESLTAYYIHRDVTRDYGIAYQTPQLLSTRWDLLTELGSTRAGTTFQEVLAYPFIGEVSRWSARQQFSREDRFFDYAVGESADDRLRVLVPLRDKHFDLAMVTRLGQRGNLSLLGLALTYQQLTYPSFPLIAVNGDITDATPADSTFLAPALDAREELNNIRLALLLGQRNVWWVKRRGLDSMRGLQDVRLGSEIGLSLGRSFPSLDADDDMASTMTAFSAFEFGSLILSGRGRLDVRRNFDAPSAESAWEDLFGEGEFLAYLRPGALPRHTLVARASGTGGWYVRTPFQLTLGGDRNLRGYKPDRFPGGRRAVFSVEDRVYIGWPWPESIDTGATLFLDVGRMWPGDAPYGLDSGWRTTAGLGVRASFPAGSRTTYRIDFAFPVQPAPSLSDVRLLISVGELIGLSAPLRDWQLMRSRYEGVAGQLFRVRP